MRLTPIAWICLTIAGLTLSSPLLALETDQFTLPPKPLADIGPEVSAQIKQVITDAMEKANRKIIVLRRKAQTTKDDDQRLEYQKRIDELLDVSAITGALYEFTGDGMPESHLEAWLKEHKFEAQPAVFEVETGDSIYGDCLLYKPLLMLAMAPEVNVHGVYQGTDKLGHFFQQGYTYFQKYRAAIAAGKSPDAARKGIVDWGREMEKTWGGLWWTGAYSNADLAANYAGFKFFLNLTEPVAFDGVTHPPMVIQKDGLWQWNPEASDDCLAAYMSEHFSEAFNPGWYDEPMREPLAESIRKRGKAWVENEHTTREAEVKRLRSLRTWHGEDYGYRGPDDLITIVNAYFDPPAAQTARK
ncbi:MAG: hypothetical protein GC162_08875 [Planctomycetes bacterium]|nr:hypothetical protein [Planctomycetota bacterium]